VICSDRSLCWTRCSISPLRRTDGKMVGLVGLLEDITEVKISQANLENSRALIAEALDSMHVGFAIWDREDRLIICNPAYRSFYPRVASALVPGMPYQEVLRTYLRTGGRHSFASDEE